MSDNLPLEMQVEIIKRLPVKSLIQFRSVSKTWKSLIDSSHFMAKYSVQPHTLTDATFSCKMLSRCTIIGSSHSLFCFYGSHSNASSSKGKFFMAVIWNLSIHKVVPVVVPNVEDDGVFRTILGFGVCNVTNDPKIVKINYIISSSDIVIESIPSQVEVFTLSTRAWRKPYSNHNLPRKSIVFDAKQHVVVDGFLYWLAIDDQKIITDNNGTRSYKLVISFDITIEEFSEVNLPDTLAPKSYYELCLSQLRESLVVLEDGS